MPFSAAAQRNQEPILEVLAGVLPEHGLVLEIASGSGQHAVHFAAELTGLTWQDAAEQVVPAEPLVLLAR